jgi:hypothetical protein
VSATNPRKLSFKQLDAAICRKAVPVKRDLATLIPYLREMRERLLSQGKRNDLKDTPDISWTAWKESKRNVIGLAPRTIDLLLETGRTTSKTSGKNRTSGTSAGGSKKPALLKAKDYRDWLIFLINEVLNRANECHPKVVHWAGEAKAFVEAAELTLREETGAAEPAASVLLLPPPGSRVLWHGEEWELEDPLEEDAVRDEHGNRRVPMSLLQRVAGTAPEASGSVA